CSTGTSPGSRKPARVRSATADSAWVCNSSRSRTSTAPRSRTSRPDAALSGSRLLRNGPVNDRPRIGHTIAQSRPAFTTPPRPPTGAPNVVVIVLDDTGFSQLGCFGSDIATPNVDQLAANGVRYRRFHVTALCSPTRACLLTGRNHHAVGMGFLP